MRQAKRELKHEQVDKVSSGTHMLHLGVNDHIQEIEVLYYLPSPLQLSYHVYHVRSRFAVFGTVTISGRWQQNQHFFILRIVNASIKFQREKNIRIPLQ